MHMKSRKVRRPPHPMWWAVSLLLVIAGTLGIVFVPPGPKQGPTIIHPIGSVTTRPSGVVVPTSTIKPTPATTSDNGHQSTTSVTSRPSATTTTLPTATLVSSPVRRSKPVHLSIPKIGLSTQLGVVGLNRDGTVEVPTNFSVPGWYDGDRTPGQKGSAVILGHVDNYNGPAVFYYLDRLRLNDRVFVTLANGKRLQFAVIGVRIYHKINFPDKLVYGPRNYPALQLVTCGGIFDPATGHYLSNIVVFTALVKS